MAATLVYLPKADVYVNLSAVSDIDRNDTGQLRIWDVGGRSRVVHDADSELLIRALRRHTMKLD